MAARLASTSRGESSSSRPIPLRTVEPTNAAIEAESQLPVRCMLILVVAHHLGMRTGELLALKRSKWCPGTGLEPAKPLARKRISGLFYKRLLPLKRLVFKNTPGAGARQLVQTGTPPVLGWRAGCRLRLLSCKRMLLCRYCKRNNTYTSAACQYLRVLVFRLPVGIGPSHRG